MTSMAIMDSFTPSWPHRLLTLADWDAMPEDELHHVECAEGVLVVTPSPILIHQHLMLRLAMVLDAQLPHELIPIVDVDTLLEESPLTVRRPDIVVVPRAFAATKPKRARAEDVRLAVEILSPGTRRLDRVMKLNEYGEFGIDEYWIVDPADPTSLVVHHHDGAGGYHLIGEYSGPVSVEALGVRLEFDLEEISRI